MFKLIRRFFTLIFLIIIGVPTFFVGQVWYSAKYSKAESAKVAVVLGAAQFDGRPSDALEARLVEAIRIYKMGIDRKSTRLNSSHSQQSRMPSSA